MKSLKVEVKIPIDKGGHRLETEITEFDGIKIHTKIQHLSAVIERHVLQILYSKGVDITNTQETKLKEDIVKLRQAGKEELAKKVEKTLKTYNEFYRRERQ